MNLSNGPRKCLVFECKNTSDLGTFIGDVCMPCHRFITTGKGYCQAYSNGVNMFIQKTRVEIIEATETLKEVLMKLEIK